MNLKVCVAHFHLKVLPCEEKQCANTSNNTADSNAVIGWDVWWCKSKTSADQQPTLSVTHGLYLY